MAKKRVNFRPPQKPAVNRRRQRQSFSEVLSQANQRAHDRVNRRVVRRPFVTIQAAIASEEFSANTHLHSGEWLRRPLRWLLGMAILPLCWVTTWAFLYRFSEVTLERGFWQTEAFWYFCIGALSITGWLWSGLLQSFFLYLYVFGHELTHAVFVLMFRGNVKDIHVSAQGGYVTTDKSNLWISLSPYFVPFWSVLLAICYALLRLTAELSPMYEWGFYAGMGATWTFHMIWTLWMLPRDQPDLRENGVFLSLVVIYFANLLVLVALFCLAAANPWQATCEFGREWLHHAATWSETVVVLCKEWLKR